MTRAARRTALALAIWIAPSAVFLSLVTCVYSTYRIATPTPLPEDARAEVMRVLRAVLDRQVIAPDGPAMNRALANRGPVVVAMWLRGKELVRVAGHGDTLGEAVTDAARLLSEQPWTRTLLPRQRAEVRIQVDVVVGRAPLAQHNALVRAIGLNPGLEGLGVQLDGDREVLLLPTDLMFSNMFGTSQPLKFIPDFKIGLNFESADMLLAKRAKLPAGGYGAASRTYFRFRTDSFVERPAGQRDAPPLRLIRGLPPAPELTADNLRRGAIAGGRYLVAHVADNGRYIYQRDLSTGRGTNPKRPGPYSIPRHAGTTYFLAELYRLTGEEFLREPIERAFAHLDELIQKGGCSGTLPGGAEFACVVDRGRKTTDLGSTALTVVALVEYQRATRDDRYADMAARMTEWILHLQRPDGSFAHRYHVPDQRIDQTAHLFYYSGESALALARMYEVTGESRYIEAAERALDHLVGWYDFFAGGFFYGEEHWTCIAAEAAWPALKHAQYVDFCHGYGAFLRAQQPAVGDFPDQDDLAGTYTFTPFLTSQNTPAGSRTEAMISSYLLGKRHGRPDEAVRGQILAALRYVLGQQIREDSMFAVSPRATGVGAVPGTPVDRSVRIDYVQHVCSAMVRAIELIESN